MKIDYSKVQEKYKDSLSQFDLHETLTDPNKFGSLHFQELENVFFEMISALYELEVFDFQEHLFPHEVKQITDFKNDLNGYFKQIQDFQTGIGNSTQPIQQQIIKQVNNHYQNNFYKIDDILTKIRTKQLLNDPKGKEIEGILAAGKMQLEEAERSKVEIEEIKQELQKTLEAAKQGTQEAGITKGQIASLKLGRFFDIQAQEHRRNAIGEEKGISSSKRFWTFTGWIGKRNLFFIFILLEIISNISIYVIGLKTDSNLHDLFTPEYGVLSLSLLLILYLGMSFATNNFSINKELEIENKNKSNIAETLELFLSVPRSDAGQSILLQEATKTLFSSPQSGVIKNKIQNVNLPMTEVTKILKSNSIEG